MEILSECKNLDIDNGDRVQKNEKSPLVINVEEDFPPTAGKLTDNFAEGQQITRKAAAAFISTGSVLAFTGLITLLKEALPYAANVSFLVAGAGAVATGGALLAISYLGEPDLEVEPQAI